MTERDSGGSTAERLQDLLLNSQDITEFLDEFTRMIAAQLTGDGDEVWCAVTLLRDSRAATVASSGPRAEALDEIQYAYGDGPCLTSAREHEVVHVPDIRASNRWPDYNEAAARAGIRSALAVPFELAGDARAGLNVYSDRAGRFDEAQIGEIRREVLQASKALRLAVRLARHQDTAADLEAAMGSRTVIDVAVGILMGRQGCSQEEAVRLLKAASNHRNLKLRDLAAEVVASVGRGGAVTHFNH